MTLRLALGFLLLGTPSALAHAPSTSYVTVDPDMTGVRLSLKLDLRDAARVVSLDADRNGEVTWGELKGAQTALVQYSGRHVSLKTAGKTCELAFQNLAVEKLSSGTFAVLSLTSPCEATSLQLRYDLFFAFDADHRAIVSAGGNAAGVLTTAARDKDLTFVVPSVGAVFREFVVQGVLHIWEGFDHMLFLITLLIPAVYRRSRNLMVPFDSLGTAFVQTLKVVTAFTVAHSVTLIMVTLGVFSLPARFVEAAIALSIIVTAVNNIRPMVGDKSWMIAGGFGLLHGCGFASVLSDLALSKATLLSSLLAFNLGVELGQAVLVVLALPLCFALRNTKGYQGPVLKWGSAAAASVAAVWMVERLFEFKVLPF